jgi:hypothetical protein
MPTDRPLHNLTRDRLFGVYTELQSEPTSKKYNLRKELQGDKRDNVVYANRWLTRDQYIEMARQEILARGLELPAAEAAEQPAAAEAPGPDAGATVPAVKPDAATAATPE